MWPDIRTTQIIWAHQMLETSWISCFSCGRLFTFETIFHRMLSGSATVNWFLFVFACCVVMVVGYIYRHRHVDNKNSMLFQRFFFLCLSWNGQWRLIALLNVLLAFMFANIYLFICLGWANDSWLQRNRNVCISLECKEQRRNNSKQINLCVFSFSHEKRDVKQQQIWYFITLEMMQIGLVRCFILSIYFFSCLMAIAIARYVLIWSITFCEFTKASGEL